MRPPRRLVQSAVSLGALTLLSGCFSGHPGIAIVNLETGAQCVRTLPGRFNEEPIDVDEATATFRTLQRSETNSILLRTVDFEGRTKTEKAWPIFDRWLENHASTGECAFSPEGDRMAYLDGKSQELRQSRLLNRKRSVGEPL